MHTWFGRPRRFKLLSDVLYLQFSRWTCENKKMSNHDNYSLSPICRRAICVSQIKWSDNHRRPICPQSLWHGDLCRALRSNWPIAIVVVLDNKVSDMMPPMGLWQDHENGSWHRDVLGVWRFSLNRSGTSMGATEVLSTLCFRRLSNLQSPYQNSHRFQLGCALLT